ncbi:hypothetical protein KUV89_01765 [Marinobacter hydrocarbonoclasticus]|nr:hypothetical protein [Marinobacter nauticus]
MKPEIYIEVLYYLGFGFLCIGFLFFSFSAKELAYDNGHEVREAPEKANYPALFKSLISADSRKTRLSIAMHLVVLIALVSAMTWYLSL